MRARNEARGEVLDHLALAQRQMRPVAHRVERGIAEAIALPVDQQADMMAIGRGPDRAAMGEENAVAAQCVLRAGEEAVQAVDVLEDRDTEDDVQALGL